MSIVESQETALSVEGVIGDGPYEERPSVVSTVSEYSIMTMITVASDGEAGSPRATISKDETKEVTEEGEVTAIEEVAAETDTVKTEEPTESIPPKPEDDGGSYYTEIDETEVPHVEEAKPDAVVQDFAVIGGEGDIEGASVEERMSTISLAEEEGTDQTNYVYIEEVLIDDLGKEVKIKQKIPIIKETHRFVRVSVPDAEEAGKPHHKFIETITRVIKQQTVNAEGEPEEFETELREVIEHEIRPPAAKEVYATQIDEKGDEIEVLVPTEEEMLRRSTYASHTEKVEAPRVRSIKSLDVTREKQKKRVLKIVKKMEVEPCTYGKVHEVMKPVLAEEEEDVLSDLDDDEYIIPEEEEMSADEVISIRDEIQRRREEKITRLKDKLRTVLVRLALAEKKRNLYMQLISISAEVKDDILNPPDPDRPSFKVPKKVKVEDKFRRLYTDKLMEYRELRSVILVKLAMEKKRKEEVKQKYDVIAAEVAELRKSLEDKLMAAVNKLLPKHDLVYKNQSALAMVKRCLNLIERLDKETKELMYKKKQMYLAKRRYDEVTENEQGLAYKFSLANMELQNLVSKNDRRNERLESLKVTMQKESSAITHINQKSESVRKTIDEKNTRLEALNQSLNRARQDRKDVHRARRKIEAGLRDERARIKLKNHPSLIKEHELIEELLRGKQLEFEHLKRECLTSLQQYKKMNGKQTEYN